MCTTPPIHIPGDCPPPRGPKVFGEVLEWYDVPRDRAVFDTPGWNGVAGGGRARRYWIHDRLLVGGSILGLEDGEHLRRDYGVTHVLSFESERMDGGKSFPRSRRCWCPFIDVHLPIHPALLEEALDFAQTVFDEFDESVLYAHCQLGGGRGPSAAYLAAVGALDMDPDLALQRIRAAGSTPHDNYIASINAVISLRRGAVQAAPGAT